ncbi:MULTISPECIES: protein kinase domain-containing protein [Ramlibacter]|uniref:Protein kinase n=1 Tax=Ramlibacter pinisoli TaxID=2682844 RepID=A0A6N8IYD1_9BURK|nr:bifunctional protein-serine/threonine kinase/phosphatase [Ramlibacter sp. CGMCC 1.13660]MVQ31060.1 protein kinase [Ramlibacter pinisoli]
MPLRIAVGQHSSAGRKPANQDFHGICLPEGATLAAKGAAVALADGISSSDSAGQASQVAVASLLQDYYCTPDAWSVRQSVDRVLAAANSWLYAQTQRGAGRYDKDRGWVCTLSALVLKGRTAHLFHVGDTRVWQLQGRALEQLTHDHRVHVGGETYLGRALGIAPQVEIDYRRLPLEAGDAFVLATDGVYDHVPAAFLAASLEQHGGDLDAAARAIVDEALRHGSNDNLTVQLLRVEGVADGDALEAVGGAGALPLPPPLAPRLLLDGLRIVRELHASSRSHAWLALDEASGRPVVVKVPATEQREDPRALERLLLEEWVARRLDNAHVLKAFPPSGRRSSLYTVMEFVDGQTLAQWMVDHPRPPLQEVRAIVAQIARGLRALHRAEMVHQDLRPENVMLDATGSAKLIDFGAVRVAGIEERDTSERLALPGMAQYMAPELFLGEAGTPASDLFSLAVLTYQLLTGRLPYGLDLPRCHSLAEQRRLRYRSLHAMRRDVPAWVDDTLLQALHPEPGRRHADVAEFVHALEHPVAGRRATLPLAERDPLTFWRTLAVLLGLCCVGLLGLLAARG